MPEFVCTNCSQRLRTSTDSVGKKAKCPQCGALVDVPADSPRQQTAVVPQGSPQNPFAPSANPTARPPSETLNPYAAPSVESVPGSPFAPFDDGPRLGLPWEQERKSIGSFCSTVGRVLFSPVEAFSQVRREGGLGDPLLFAVAGGLCGALISAVYNSLLQLLIFAFLTGTGERAAEVRATMGLQVAGQFLIAFLGGTIGVACGLFLSAGLYHLFLRLLNGAHYPFEATFRVAAYVTGAVSLVQVIPICGQYVYLLAAIAFTMVGLQPVQQTTSGKALAAVLLPMLVCIFLPLALLASFAIATL